MAEETKKFAGNMTIGEALRLHSRAGEALASFHLGGCSHCALNESETINQVTAGYGIDDKILLGTLNNLLTD
jgi:hypothetical protein